MHRPERPDPYPPQGLDLSRPNVARVYDWYLGGTANWAIDREFGQRVLQTLPLAKPMATANRLFLHRAVRRLVKLGVRQFVDIGSGVPTMGNTHQVADEVSRDTRVVYVDNEPVAVAHSQVLLEENGDPDRHAVINADLRDPDRLWERVTATGVVDPSEPVALLIIAVMHVQQPGPDGGDVGPAAVARYRELLSSGSYLAISQVSDEDVPEPIAASMDALKAMYDRSGNPVVWRSHADIRALFGDFELIEPGMSWVPEWHPEESSDTAPVIEFDTPSESIVYAGVARKP